MNDLNIAPPAAEQSQAMGEAFADPTVFGCSDKTDYFDVFLAQAMQLAEQAAEKLPVGGQSPTGNKASLHAMIKLRLHLK